MESYGGKSWKSRNKLITLNYKLKHNVSQDKNSEIKLLIALISFKCVIRESTKWFHFKSTMKNVREIKWFVIGKKWQRIDQIILKLQSMELWIGGEGLEEDLIKIDEIAEIYLKGEFRGITNHRKLMLEGENMKVLCFWCFRLIKEGKFLRNIKRNFRGKFKKLLEES